MTKVSTSVDGTTINIAVELTTGDIDLMRQYIIDYGEDDSGLYINQYTLTANGCPPEVASVVAKKLNETLQKMESGSGAGWTNEQVAHAMAKTLASSIEYYVDDLDSYEVMEHLPSVTASGAEIDEEAIENYFLNVVASSKTPAEIIADLTPIMVKGGSVHSAAHSGAGLGEWKPN